MERTSVLQITIFLVVVSLSYSAPVEDDDEARVTKGKPLLEKLGMELYSDPHMPMPYKKRCYCGYLPPLPPMPWTGYRRLPRPYRPVSRTGDHSSDEEEDD